MKRLSFFNAAAVLSLLAIVVFSSAAVKRGGIVPEKWFDVIEDTCVYSNNNHVAFTTLNEWEGCLYLAFREAESHEATSANQGVIRVLIKKGDEWETHHVFSIKGADLRDPCFVKWNNRFLIYTSGHYSELLNGEWTELKPIRHNAPHYIYIWKIRPFNNELYGIGHCWNKWPLLMKSVDGENWTVVDEFQIGGNATEADLLFVKDKLYVCFRVELPYGSNSMWGVSKYPFMDFEWTKLNFSIDSPEMLLYSRKTILLSGRECYYNRDGGKIERRVTLFALDKKGKVKGSAIINNESNDQGYGSFYSLDGKRVLMSYYAGGAQTEIRTILFSVKDSNL